MRPRPAPLLLATLAAALAAGSAHAEPASLRARWRVEMPAPRMAWLAPGEAAPAAPSPEVVLRVTGPAPERGPPEALEVVVGESTPRALYLAARTRVGYRVLARFNRRDSAPFELALEARGSEITVTCAAYDLRVTAGMFGVVPGTGEAAVRTRGGAGGALLEFEAAARARELPPAKRYIPPGEGAP